MQKNGLNNVALIAEIISALAVVISLLYVGIEVNRNTSESKLANQHSILSSDIETKSWLKDPLFAGIHLKGATDYDGLEPVQKTQLDTFIALEIGNWEFLHISHSDDLIDNEFFVAFDIYYRSRMVRDDYQSFWLNARLAFSESFRAYVDSVLDEISN